MTVQDHEHHEEHSAHQQDEGQVSDRRTCRVWRYEECAQTEHIPDETPGENADPGPVAAFEVLDVD